jgi:hypothetical protein
MDRKRINPNLLPSEMFFEDIDAFECQKRPKLHQTIEDEMQVLSEGFEPIGDMGVDALVRSMIHEARLAPVEESLAFLIFQFMLAFYDTILSMNGEPELDLRLLGHAVMQINREKALIGILMATNLQFDSPIFQLILPHLNSGESMLKLFYLSSQKIPFRTILIPRGQPGSLHDQLCRRHIIDVPRSLWIALPSGDQWFMGHIRIRITKIQKLPDNSVRRTTCHIAFPSWIKLDKVYDYARRLLGVESNTELLTSTRVGRWIYVANTDQRVSSQFRDYFGCLACLSGNLIPTNKKNHPLMVTAPVPCTCGLPIPTITNCFF